MKKMNRLTVKGDVLDRGQLKWGSLMLPEHVRMLREWEAADPANEKPHLDEEELHLLQEEIGIAYRRGCTAEIRYWENQLAAVSGQVTDIDLQRQTVAVSGVNGAIRIPFKELIGIRLID